MACSPVHVEARAMREASRYVAEMNYYPCTFYTDSQKDSNTGYATSTTANGTLDSF